LHPATPLHRYAQVTVVFAALVLFAGAMVTSTGSGMAVPDWPQSFGTWTRRWPAGCSTSTGTAWWPGR